MTQAGENGAPATRLARKLGLGDAIVVGLGSMIGAGAYVYGRRRLGDLWGFLAGWAFVIGKLASCAAMALTFGRCLLPDGARLLAIAAVAALTAVNYFGIRKTTGATRSEDRDPGRGGYRPCAHDPARRPDCARPHAADLRDGDRQRARCRERRSAGRPRGLPSPMPWRSGASPRSLSS